MKNLAVTNLIPSDFVIVIGRQCGSGGRELGKALAARLGVPYYDRRLLTDASKELGMRTDLLERNDERRPSGLLSWLSSSCGAPEAAYSGPTFSARDLQILQGKVLRGLLERGACVIVGRGADYIGRDLPNILSVFLHAPMDRRVENMRKGEAAGMSDAEIVELINRTDRRRGDYYNDFTGRRWGAADNYHLCIDSSLTDKEAIVDMIVTLLQRRCAGRE